MKILVLGWLLACAAQVAAAPPTGGPTAAVSVPEPTPQAVRFHHTGNLWWLASRAWSITVPLALALSGLGARLRDWAWKRGRNWLGAGLLFVVAYLVVVNLIHLPLGAYLGFVRPRAYGLSNQSFVDWLVDEGKEFGVTLAVAVPAFFAVYGLIARFPKRWWLACGLLALPAIAFLALVAPVWIDPLYNEFRPMRDKALEARILALAARCGIDVDRVFEVDMSRKTSAVNAYVTGLWGTKRIVLWDTLIAKLEPDQVAAVMGHEMGHYVLNHVWQGVLVVSLLSLLGLYLAHRILAWLIPRWAHRTRVRGLDDFASLPLLVAAALALNLLLAPVGYAFSRHMEHEADQFSLELTRDNRAAATSFVALQRENLGYPRPGWLYQVVRSTHPSLGERVDFANAYAPWKRGEPPRFAIKD